MGKIIFKLGLCISFIVMVSFNAHSRLIGGVSDGGGQGVVCYDQEKNIESVELLDLFEAKHFHSFNLKKFGGKNYLQIAKEITAMYDTAKIGVEHTGTSTRHIDGVFDGVELHFIDYVNGVETGFQRSLLSFDSGKNLLPPGLRLNPIEDSNPEIDPGKCKIEQLARFQDKNGRLHIVSDFWESMDDKNKAALLVHEVLYQSLRIEGETNSDRTRVAIGFSFSEDTFFEDPMSGVPEGALACWSNDSEVSYRFFAYENGPNFVTLQFLHIERQLLLTKTLFNIPRKNSPFVEHDSKNRNIFINDLSSPIIESPNIVVASPRDLGEKNDIKMEIQVASGGTIPSPLKYKIQCKEYK